MIGTQYAGKKNKLKLLNSEYNKGFQPQSVNSAKHSSQVNNTRRPLMAI